jgi:hypothetical protein
MERFLLAYTWPKSDLPPLSARHRPFAYPIDPTDRSDLRGEASPCDRLEACRDQCPAFTSMTRLCYDGG